MSGSNVITRVLKNGRVGKKENKGDKNMRIWLDASEFKDEGIGL